MNDGASLRAKLRIANRRKKLTALMLLAPALAIMLLAFVWPIASLLTNSVHAPRFADAMPALGAWLAEWDGTTLPGEEGYALVAEEFARAYKAKTLPRASRRLNYEQGGLRSLAMKTGRKARRMTPPYKAALLKVNKAWGELETWQALQAASRRLTDKFLLQALDLRRDAISGIERAAPDNRVYLDRLGVTFWISIVVTVLCALIGYPMSYVMATSGKTANRLLFILVLLPFWISLLVRTAAWVVLLQKEGIINDGLLWLGLVDEPQQLIFNRIGVYIAMIHILLPFLILPLYSVMRSIARDQVRAANSLGASPFEAFLTVYFPQTIPGLGAGCLLVFILSIGFYVTPALVGGSADQMISALIAEFALGTANWGLASALALVLLCCVAVIYPVFGRYAGAKNLSLG
ncbi:MAG: ABC transporter permease [Alphaproteobacteria bacterium]|jgi:putative spermidine/putrescine transport system permease protein|nr:ABC transporter permease [Alphaproteobacteria bacterium]